MKISAFAQANQVTVKCLRYYDEIGLLKPNAIHPVTGYREYSAQQSATLNWILILKNLGFNLASIQLLLQEEMNTATFLLALKERRMAITRAMNDSLSKKVMIDRLIQTLEKEGFEMKSTLNLLSLDQQSINDIKKQMPVMEVFLENTLHMVSLLEEGQSIAFLRVDISHFKQVNDNYGYDVGDLVILTIYQTLATLLEPFEDHATIGRAGGDEFVVSIICSEEELNQLCHTYIERVKAIDFNALGCKEQKGIYIAGTTCPTPTYHTIRQTIEATWEYLEQARQQGTNAIYLHTPTKTTTQ